jgi:hypothetical protein
LTLGQTIRKRMDSPPIFSLLPNCTSSTAYRTVTEIGPIDSKWLLIYATSNRLALVPVHYDE